MFGKVAESPASRGSSVSKAVLLKPESTSQRIAAERSSPAAPPRRLKMTLYFLNWGQLKTTIVLSGWVSEWVSGIFIDVCDHQCLIMNMNVLCYGWSCDKDWRITQRHQVKDSELKIPPNSDIWHQNHKNNHPPLFSIGPRQTPVLLTPKTKETTKETNTSGSHTFSLPWQREARVNISAADIRGSQGMNPTNFSDWLPFQTDFCFWLFIRCEFKWSVLTTTGWIPMKFGTDIQGPQRLNRPDFHCK